MCACVCVCVCVCVCTRKCSRNQLHHVILTATARSFQYHQPLLNMPAFCDGCGSHSSMEHALDCIIGGLVIQRHNEIRDAFGDLASIAYKEVIREPVVREADDKNN